MDWECDSLPLLTRERLPWNCKIMFPYSLKNNSSIHPALPFLYWWHLTAGWEKRTMCGLIPSVSCILETVLSTVFLSLWEIQRDNELRTSCLEVQWTTTDSSFFLYKRKGCFSRQGFFSKSLVSVIHMPGNRIYATHQMASFPINIFSPEIHVSFSASCSFLLTFSLCKHLLEKHDALFPLSISVCIRFPDQTENPFHRRRPTNFLSEPLTHPAIVSVYPNKCFSLKKPLS